MTEKAAVQPPYSSGRLQFPSKDDPCYQSREDADIAAIEASADDQAYAVWDNKTGELLSVAFGLELFTK